MYGEQSFTKGRQSTQSFEINRENYSLLAYLPMKFNSTCLYFVIRRKAFFIYLRRYIIIQQQLS
jgi:hypothetical protein